MLLACASTASRQEHAGPTAIVIEGMVIRNELPFPVTEVMINVPETGAFGGCGNIMQRSECRTGFEAVEYTGNSLVVNWKEYGEPHTTGAFRIDGQERLNSGKPAWLEVVIFARGQAGARLVQ